MARPTIQTPDLQQRVIRKLTEGASFRSFDSDDTLPSTATIRRWRMDDAGFDAECARACEASADADYDAMERIEARVLLPAADPERLDAKAANTVLSNMRWRMEKRKPRTYGQKVQVEAKMTLEQLVGASLPQSE